MQIVLIKKVKTLGNPGEVKEVSRGYAINFLIPEGLAMPATKGFIKEANLLARKFEKTNAVDMSAMAVLIKEINGIEFTIFAKANDKGSLFAAIKEENIAEEILNKIGKSVDTEYIIIKEPIKKVGDFEVAIESGENKGVIKVRVEGKK